MSKSERDARYYAKNREAISARRRELYRVDPTRRAKAVQASRQARGIWCSPTQYSVMWWKQEGRCAICRKPEPIENRSLAVDHDHKTGEIRGLLCGGCNNALGRFNDDAASLRRAAEYLS